MRQTLESAAFEFQEAITAVRNAVDSRGLRIRLYPSSTSYTSNGFRTELRRFTKENLAADVVAYISIGAEGDGQDADGEITFARNLKLLANAYVAALEYERAGGT